MNYAKYLYSFLLFFALASLLQAQEGTGQQQQRQSPAAAGGPASIKLGNSGLVLEVLEDFEEAEDWAARATSPLGITKLVKFVQRGAIQAAGDENVRPPETEAYSVIQNPDNPNHILGVKTYFSDRGFDRVELSPPHELAIRGKARQFSVWVLGRNFRHTLFIKLRDYRGKIHKLRIGMLNFFGWRKMTVVVPGWLPQSTRYALLGRHLHFVSLFVVSDYHEPRGDFYFYVDGLKALIDRGEQSYPGAEIKDSW